LIYTPPPPVVIVVSSGVTSSGLSVTSGNGISVLSGGTMSGITVAAGGSAVIAAGGEDSGTTIQAGGTETVSGDASGDLIYGSQIVTSGGSAATIPATVENETVFNGGTVELYLKPDVGTGITVSSGGLLLLSGNVSATNTTLDAGAFMALQSPKAVFNGTLTFSGAATIDVTAVTSAGFGGLGVISGWGAGDVIDETLISSTVATLTTTTSGGNTVETISGATYPDSFIFEGTDEAAHVALVPDGGSGVELAYVTCFFPGTRIAAPGGETVVEELQPGDLVWLADGGVAPVRWVGVQTISRTFADPARVLPVRIRAGALDGTVPTRDLLVSPGHALLLDGTLAHAGTLVGFDGITREYATTDTFRYYHIELDAHALLLAEGVAAESYLPLAEDVAFDNRAERPPSPMMVEMPYPRAKAPRQLPQALRARLARRTAA
jgi:autotransporter passenger strand-loop-strand repeat protein